jgi:hypothetical protein
MPLTLTRRVISLMSTGASRLLRSFLCTHKKLISTIFTADPCTAICSDGTGVRRGCGRPRRTAEQPRPKESAGEDNREKIYNTPKREGDSVNYSETSENISAEIRVAPAEIAPRGIPETVLRLWVRHTVAGTPVMMAMSFWDLTLRTPRCSSGM